MILYLAEVGMWESHYKMQAVSTRNHQGIDGWCQNNESNSPKWTKEGLEEFIQEFKPLKI